MKAIAACALLAALAFGLLPGMEQQWIPEDDGLVLLVETDAAPETLCAASFCAASVSTSSTSPSSSGIHCCSIPGRSPKASAASSAHACNCLHAIPPFAPSYGRTGANIPLDITPYLTRFLERRMM